MDGEHEALRDDLVRQRAADPDGEISAERMEKGFDVAEAMVRERDEDSEHTRCEPTREGPNR